MRRRVDAWFVGLLIYLVGQMELENSGVTHDKITDFPRRKEPLSSSRSSVGCLVGKRW